MAVPAPDELIAEYGAQAPERLAAVLGFHVSRVPEGPHLPGVTVMSEFCPPGEICLYRPALRRAAEVRGRTTAWMEQWHIAHELYHGLAEQDDLSAWRVRETAADLWADELLALLGPDVVANV